MSSVILAQRDITFFGGCEFIINGTVNITNGASINMNLGTNIVINSTGTLFLDWGSTLTGSTPTLYEPSIPMGNETPISGDRIICMNGGIIKTRPINEYYSGASEIFINSSTDYLWDGIFIKNPGDEDDFYFVNCDISGIRKLSIENIAETRNSANLNLYITDFHEAGQVIARDGHLLYIHGEDDENRCLFFNNETTPITVYDSQVDISYCSISQNDCGIYIYGSSGTGSTINYCDFFDNSGEGVKLDGSNIGFHHNNIYNNDRFGLLAYPGTSFYSIEPLELFDYITFEDNGYSEYLGWPETFFMTSDRTEIKIKESDFNSGYDQYLLVNPNWDGISQVDIQGVSVWDWNLNQYVPIAQWIVPDNWVHLLPSVSDAWNVGSEIPDEKLMLYSASYDMGLGNYSTAESTLQSLISTYSLTQEAGTAVNYLYHLEGLTDSDYPALILYLESLVPESDSPLEKAIDVIITKSYMKDKDYLTAIDRLEYVIEYSQDPDEVIMAMIDEGYCYLELSDEGERSLPSNCTIQTTTIDSYQATVNALESQLSFFPEEGEDEDEDVTPPTSKVLTLSNYPNPFNPTTSISFSLPEDSEVELSIFNIKGQKVKTVVNEFLEKGVHSIEWNGTDSNNKTVASGLYFYQISADKKFKMKKMLLLK